MTDWKAEIAKLVQWKQLVHDRDKLGALPWHLPAVAAPPERIEAAEREAGLRFADEYRQFLGFADGWRGFYVLIDLYGTQDILAGKSHAILDRPEVAAFIAANGLGAREVVAIGGSELETDTFLLVAPESEALPGGVIWWADEEIDRFPDFAAFFAAMTAYNARLAEKLAKQG